MNKIIIYKKGLGYSSLREFYWWGVWFWDFFLENRLKIYSFNFNMVVYGRYLDELVREM